MSRGEEEAGELLAAFEMFEVVSGVDKLPELPNVKEEVVNIAETGPILPVPPLIRPKLVRYRFEVLFWGLRDLKKIQFLPVNHPRVDIECGGHVIQSSMILNAKKNPNFSSMVKYLDLELPEQEIYCPPLTIRVLDCRYKHHFVNRLRANFYVHSLDHLEDLHWLELTQLIPYTSSLTRHLPSITRTTTWGMWTPV